MAIDPAAIAKLAEGYTAAWNSGSAEEVAAFYAPDGSIAINRGPPWQGRTGVAEMAAGFFAEIPDLSLTCDAVHCAGDHVAYHWTFTGTHAASGNAMRVSGWEEWDIGADGLIAASRGWFDGAGYEQQATAD